ICFYAIQVIVSSAANDPAQFIDGKPLREADERIEECVPVIPQSCIECGTFVWNFSSFYGSTALVVWAGGDGVEVVDRDRCIFVTGSCFKNQVFKEIDAQLSIGRHIQHIHKWNIDPAIGKVLIGNIIQDVQAIG